MVDGSRQVLMFISSASEIIPWKENVIELNNIEPHEFEQISTDFQSQNVQSVNKINVLLFNTLKWASNETQF